MAPAWTKKDIPPQTGKIVVVTGATGGLGYETALYFAEAGATVIVAGRNEIKGQEALEKLNAACPNAVIVFGKVDLCSLASIKNFCCWFLEKYQLLDILVNNAGVSVTTQIREVTEDGFEIQMGTNHLAHFALTAQLLPALRRSSNPRIVNISSLMAHFGKIDFEDLQFEKNFKGFKDYGTTKLANLLFTFELQRRSDEHGWGLTVNAAHPGGANTEGAAKGRSNFGAIAEWFSFQLSHSAADGALCTMYAATAPEATKLGYYGPQNCFGAKGPPGPARIPKAAKDIEVAKKLWEASERLTSVTWPNNS